MTLYSDQKTYRVLEPFTISYDIGRDGLGVVSESFKTGDTIVGQLREQGIRYNAIYKHNGKFYNTGVFIDPKKLSETYFVETAPARYTPAQARSFFILTMAIAFGFLMGRK